MIDSLLDFALGPFRTISDFYFENQTIFNTIVIGVALLNMFGKKKQTQKNTSV